MTPACILFAVAFAVAAIFVVAWFGYRCGWRDAEEEGLRKVWHCKLWWAGKLDESECETEHLRDVLRYTATTARQAMKENCVMRAREANLGRSRN